MRIPFALTQIASGADYAYTNNGLEVDLGIKFNSFMTIEGDTILLAFDESGNGFALRKSDIEGWAEILDEQVLIDAAQDAATQITQATPTIIDSAVSESVTQSNQYTDQQIASVASGFQGAIAISDTPIEDGIYIPSESGTYTHADGIVVDLADGLTLIVKTGSDFSKILIPIDLSGYATTTFVQDQIDDIGIPNTVKFGVDNPENGTTNSTILTYIFFTPLSKGTLMRVNVYSSGSGILKIKRFRMSDDDLTLIYIDEINVNMSAGLNQLVTPELDFEDGDYIGFYSDTAIRFHNKEGQFSPCMRHVGDITSDMNISDLTPVSSAFKIEIGFIFKNKDFIPDLVDKVNALSIFQYFLKEFKFGPEPADAAANSTKSLTYIFDQQLGDNYILTNIKFFSIGDGSVKIKKIRKDGSSYTFVEEILIPAIPGINDYTLQTPIKFSENERVAIFTDNAVFKHDTVPLALNPFHFVDFDLVTEANVTDAISNLQIQIEFTFETFSANTSIPLKGNEILAEIFKDTIPTNLSLKGADWTVNSGDATPGDQGLQNALEGVDYTNFNQIIIRAIVKLNDGTARAGLYSRNLTFAQSGSIIDIDISTNKLSIYDNWDGTDTLPGIYTDKLLAFGLVTGRDYQMEIKKDGKDMTYAVTDMLTGESDSLSVIGGNVAFPETGYAYGAPGIFSISGSVSFKSIKYVIAGTKHPNVLFYGDSITEGYKINSEDTYSYKAISEMGGDGYISAQSSCKAIDVIERLQEELTVFKPDYIHVLIGTNDTSTGIATWSDQIDAIKQIADTLNVKVIFGCLVSVASQLPAWNAELISKGYRIVRYDLAVTTNNDGINQDASLFLSDLVHPNQAGQLAMFNRLKLDAPELFDIL